MRAGGLAILEEYGAGELIVYLWLLPLLEGESTALFHNKTRAVTDTVATYGTCLLS